jgi:hypothetical protein
MFSYTGLTRDQCEVRGKRGRERERERERERGREERERRERANADGTHRPSSRSITSFFCAAGA